MSQPSPLKTSPTTPESDQANFMRSRPEFMHPSLRVGDNLVALPSDFLLAVRRTTSLKAQPHRSVKLHGIKHYEEAYKLFDRTKHRQAIRLAQATRRSLDMQKELALQRIREGQMLMDMLHSEAQISQLKVDEVDIQIGMMRAELKSEGIKDENDEENEENEENFLAIHDDNFQSDPGSDEKADQQYYDLAASPKPHNALTEEALRELDGLAKE